ncbi:hypothetical protein DFQ00_102221 [Paenibacillus barcinonensis]|uniref:Uncharacterized protein n=1 Tax=Paenibacillus barcinonensis TaxID=198119 RepID=A0A2V4VVF1_PAEBA|nr:hypothetical protein DFQ00_102221 [Paenibacillus barcinonensis]
MNKVDQNGKVIIEVINLEKKLRSETHIIPNLGTLIINGEPSVENCKMFVKILMDSKRRK